MDIDETGLKATQCYLLGKYSSSDDVWLKKHDDDVDRVSKGPEYLRYAQVFWEARQ
jgi:hypothetical protein